MALFGKIGPSQGPSCIFYSTQPLKTCSKKMEVDRLAEIPARATVQRVLPPDKWREKQITTLKSVGRANYLTGIAYPKRDPIEAGKSDAAEARYAAMMRLVLDERRRKKGLEPLTIDDWYKYAKEIGADILVDAVVKREAKVARFINTWQPMLVDHLAKIDPLSVETLEDRITKAAENIRGLAAMRATWKGR